MNIKSLSFRSILVILLTLSFSACSEYWWTRGQPPSTQELFDRANEKISESLKSRSHERPEVAANAIEVQKGLNVLNGSEQTQEQILSSLKTIEVAFKNIERKVSYGNRPPLNELSGQLRALEHEILSNSITNEGRFSALRLFGSRVLNYFSTELNVPAPDPIA